MKASANKFDLMTMTKELVDETMSNKSSRKSMNDYLLEVLLDVKKPMTKSEVVAIIAPKRMLDKNSQEFYESKTEAEVRKLLAAEIKTTSNGFDTSTCNGQNNSCFSYNEDYKAYELIKHPNRTYEIKRRK